jgi:hypothetical protein
MKHMKLFTAAIAAFMIFTATSSAQPKEKNNWHQKMQSEMIAFITAELELTPEEAQVFWPVYNQIAKTKSESHKTVAAAYKVLKEALDNENASDEQVNRLLDEYLAAKKANNDSDKGEVEKYRKILPAKNVVKLYTAQEKFSRNHIRNFKGKNYGKPEKK